MSPWTADLAALDPDLRPAVERVVARLEAQGFHPVVTCTYRSADVQDLLYEVGGGATRARGGQSCHNHTVGGAPASWAADVWDGGLSLGLMVGDHDALAAQVPFLRALGVAARAEGLAWGGDWSRRAPWSEWNLGWDPAHVEDRRCAGR